MFAVERIANTWVFSWMAGLFIAHGVFFALFRRSAYFAQSPGFAAHQLVCFIPLGYLTSMGVCMWFFDCDFVAAFKDNKMWGHYEPGLAFAQVVLAFQVWDIVICLITPELRKIDNLLHHLSTAFLSFSALRNGDHGFLVYYVPFFVGVTELSSLPLTMMDFFKMNKATISSLRNQIKDIEGAGGSAKLEKQQFNDIDDFDAAYPTLNLVCTISFAVSFLIIRCLYWPFVCLDFWQVTLASCCNPVLVIWLFLNVVMTILQYYWGFLIVTGIIKFVKGDEEIPKQEPLKEVLIQ